VGRARIHGWIHSLATRLTEGLTEIPGVKLHTGKDDHLACGLTAFSVMGVAPDALENQRRESYNRVIRATESEERGTRGV
jgi:selenocysteine lyase/cysteine desulfurase